jgi:hypothetical protein
MTTTTETMNSITADRAMDREARNLEAQRLSDLTGRAIDWRTVDCRCDELKRARIENTDVVRIAESEGSRDV